MMAPKDPWPIYWGGQDQVQQSLEVLPTVDGSEIR